MCVSVTQNFSDCSEARNVVSSRPAALPEPHPTPHHPSARVAPCPSPPLFPRLLAQVKKRALQAHGNNTNMMGKDDAQVRAAHSPLSTHSKYSTHLVVHSQ